MIKGEKEIKQKMLIKINIKTLYITCAQYDVMIQEVEGSEIQTSRSHASCYYVIIQAMVLTIRMVDITGCCHGDNGPIHHGNDHCDVVDSQLKVVGPWRCFVYWLA